MVAWELDGHLIATYIIFEGYIWDTLVCNERTSDSKNIISDSMFQPSPCMLPRVQGVEKLKRDAKKIVSR
jgi:hypothetical protein